MIVERFEREFVAGWLHRPDSPPRGAAILAHGAGSNCEAPLLLHTAEAFARAGFGALRCDLPFRRKRPTGPPLAGDAARDRLGLHRTAAELRALFRAPLVLGGHSYGGRMASMVAAEDPTAAALLLLLSYPLHPPRKPAQARTAHFPRLHTPALFVHGSRDGFGTLEELREAMLLIPAPARLEPVESVGHDLGRRLPDVAARAAAAAMEMLAEVCYCPPNSAPSQSPWVE